ncbi:serine hydrolase [Luteibacter sp. 329MFSha]|uniref:serine hydrolase domain-containing protein n=1 Tax=Luteibacter sp. 329MFSha TaxID=1798239 RepID=UPI000AA663E2|nr:serine hydrolase [Luteibacter sp. 329MFSha]
MRPLTPLFLLIFCAALPAGTFAMSVAGDKALATLLDRARATHSDAVVVWQDGLEVGHYYKNGRAPGPIELMSVTKSVVALGIGQLIASGKLKSVDQPVADFYPEWRQGRKKDITLRMLMNHTSGLQNVRRADEEIYPAPDAVQLALAAELTTPPGQVLEYNNKAVNLLSGVIEKASGERMDRFFRDGLFHDMDIRFGTWEADSGGRPYAMSGLPLTAADLGKLGTLVMNRGRWQGRQLVPAAYVDTMLGTDKRDDSPVGLLWWRLAQWQHFEPDPAAFAYLRQHGVPEETADTLERGLRDKRFGSVQAMFAGLQAVLGPKAQAILDQQLISRGIGPYRLFHATSGPYVAFNANGDGGQFVVVVPAAGIVAVRQIDSDVDRESAGEAYEDFVERVVAIAQAEGRLPPIPSL